MCSSHKLHVQAPGAVWGQVGSASAGRVRSRLVGESRVRVRREGSRHACSCGAAVRLCFPQRRSRTKARTEGKGAKHSVFGCDPGKAMLKSCERCLMNSVRAVYLRRLSVQKGRACSGRQSCVSALGWSVLWREASRKLGKLLHVKELVVVSALISAQQPWSSFARRCCDKPRKSIEKYFMSPVK